MTCNWEPGCQYNAGDKVRYNGCTYKIVQAHRSQSDWAPDVVPALWARVNNDDGDCRGENKHHHQGSHDGRQQECHQEQQHQQQTAQQPYQQVPQPPQAQQAPVAPPPQPHVAQQYGDQPQQPNYGAIPEHVVPPNSDDPRKQKQDGFNIGSLHFGEDALKVGGGILGTAAALGIGAFAYDKFRDAKEAKGDEQWGAENWLTDARRRQGEYLEKIKADASLPPVTWILTEGGAIPQGAIQAGQDARTNEPWYVGRAFHQNGVYIGKASGSQGDGCHIAYKGKEVVVQHYEILLGYASAVRWIDGVGALRNHEQYRMVEGGKTPEGAPVYVAQAHVRDNSVIPGGVSEKGKGCYVAYGRDESIERTYRYLTYA